MRVVLRAQSRLLHHPDLHPVVSDRRLVMGLLLAESRRRASPCSAGHHDRTNDDDPYIKHERVAAEDLLSKEHRRLSRDVLLHGVRVASRVRLRQFHFSRLCAGTSRWLLISESISSSGLRCPNVFAKLMLSSATMIAVAIVPNVYVISSSHLYIGFHQLLFPSTIRCIIVFYKALCLSSDVAEVFQF